MQHVCCKGERTPPKPRSGERFSRQPPAENPTGGWPRVARTSRRFSPNRLCFPPDSPPFPLGLRLVGSRSGVPRDQTALLARDLQLVVLGDLSQLPQGPRFQLTD